VTAFVVYVAGWLLLLGAAWIIERHVGLTALDRSRIRHRRKWHRS
jgi:hypothetical protein